MQRPIPLARLQKGREKNGIMVRVVRKWILKENSGQGDALYVGLVFADAKGDYIYGEIPKETIPKKEYLLQIGAVYLVKKFRVSSAKPFYKPFPATLMIELTEFTTIEAVAKPPASIPLLIYNLSQFATITPVTGAVFSYTDVVGYITKYSALSTFVPKNKEKVTKLREVYLKDLRDNELKITLWGDLAVDFGIDHIYNKDIGNLVVCLFVGCIPRRLHTDYSKCYLSGSAACAYYLNPQIPEAEPFHARFKDSPLYIDCPATSEESDTGTIQDAPLQLKTVDDLNNIDPFDFENGTYKCAVTIVSIPSVNTWWYMSCTPCKKKAEQQADHRYRCPKCLGYDVMPRYSLSFVGQDDTGDARFFAFDEEARLIVQKECEAIMNPLMNATGLPPALQRIIGKNYVFGVDLTDESCASNLRRQYVVKSVLERPRRQSLPTNVVSSAMMVENMDAGTSKQVEFHMAAASGGLTSASNSAKHTPDLQNSASVAAESIPKTPAPALLLPATEREALTPPSTEVNVESSSKKPMTDVIPVSKDVRRTLFPVGQMNEQEQSGEQDDRNTESGDHVEGDGLETESEQKKKRKKNAGSTTSSSAKRSK